MALIVVDAGVVIAVLDSHDVHHQPARDALGGVLDRGDSLVLPASAYAEILVAPLRAGHGTAAVDLMIDTLPLGIRDATRVIARRAAELRARHGSRLRLPDALVVATGMELGAASIMTTDSRWPKLPIRVEVLRAAGG